jgi:hypothetical protein
MLLTPYRNRRLAGKAAMYEAEIATIIKKAESTL